MMIKKNNNLLSSTDKANIKTVNSNKGIFYQLYLYLYV